MVICPICRKALSCGEAVWRCESGHSFDVARQGYVNLLPVQQKHSIAPGDSKEMVVARRDFLNTGTYAPIAQAVCELLRRHAEHAKNVLDAGCGEGYYLSHLTHISERWGIDISKEAVRFAAARDKSAHFLTASAAHLPFADASFDCVMSMFAFTAAAEFARVLRPDGIFLQVTAGRGHLSAMKKIIYPQIIEKDPAPTPVLEGFTLLVRKELSFEFSLHDQKTIHDLLYMTPHVHRIGAAGAEALSHTKELNDRAEVVFHVYCLDKSAKI